MSDPLQDGPGRELFAELVKVSSGHALASVLNASTNLMVNVIRQDVALRKDAEAAIDELFGRAKTVLLEHYDATTGKRRTVLPFTQRIEMPFHEEPNLFFGR